MSLLVSAAGSAFTRYVLFELLLKSKGLRVAAIHNIVDAHISGFGSDMIIYYNNETLSGAKRYSPPLIRDFLLVRIAGICMAILATAVICNDSVGIKKAFVINGATVAVVTALQYGYHLFTRPDEYTPFPPSSSY